MKPLDLTKPLQTRLGEKAELVYDGLTGDWPLAVVVHLHSGKIAVRTYTREGVFHDDATSISNLVNVPETRTFWLNIYENRQSGHPNRRLADYYANPDRIACIEVTYAEGEGL